MRKLKTSDLFAFARLIRKVGIKDELKQVAIKVDKIEDVAAIGFDVFYMLFEKATEENVENAIYEFIATLFECKPEEVRDGDPFDIIEKLKEMADWKQWKAFFKTAARSI